MRTRDRYKPEKAPAEWVSWCQQHGSPELRRALQEGYPFLGMLRKEIAMACCPPVALTMRACDLGPGVLELGAPREPNAESFLMLDRLRAAVSAALSAANAPGVAVHWSKICRATLHLPEGDVFAAGVRLTISNGPACIQAAYIWDRSDKESS